MPARSWSAALLILGVADLAAINLAVAPRLLPEIPLTAAVDDIAARRPLAPAPQPPAPRDDADDRDEPRTLTAAIEPAPAPSVAPALSDAPAPAAAVEAEPDRAAGDGLAPPPVIIHFRTDRATLWPDAQAQLDRVATELAARPDWSLEVAGHADARGTDHYNTLLSERRVRRVREYLASRGVPESRVRGRAFGERRPVAVGADERALHRNRRVEIAFTRSQP